VLVLELSMPGRNGLDLIELIKANRPKLPILVFSLHNEKQYAIRTLGTGASDYLTKDSDSDLLVVAIRRVANSSIRVDAPKTHRVYAYHWSRLLHRKRFTYHSCNQQSSRHLAELSAAIGSPLPHFRSYKKWLCQISFLWDNVFKMYLPYILKYIKDVVGRYTPA